MEYRKLKQKATDYLHQKNYGQAVAIYEHCIEVNSGDLSNYWYLGLAYLLQGDEVSGQTIWTSVLSQANSEDTAIWLEDLIQLLKGEANFYFQQNQLLSAEIIEEKIREIAGNQAQDSPEILLHLGYSAYHQGNYAEAINQYQKFLSTQIGDVELYNVLAECYKNLNQPEAVIQTYQEGIKHHPQEGILYRNLSYLCQELGLLAEAESFVNEALTIFPKDLSLKRINQWLLPVIYNTPEEIDFYRSRFRQKLDELIQQTPLNSPEEINQALDAIYEVTNFYLQYQGKNDLEIQIKYGEFVHKIMAANCPQWTKSLPILPTSPAEKLKIGYISAHLKDHNGAAWALDWIKNTNRDKFEIYCYYLGNKIDKITTEFQENSDFFYHIPEQLTTLIQQIFNDKLHVLIYTDIGMNPQTTLAAALRLAPIQCTAWGHPVTSGLPTIDYYLSGDLMEPENGEEHYSEQLIRLPNVGLCYPKPELPKERKKRSYFQLSEQKILYISCQSIYKYLPQYDYLFPAIAQSVTNAQFAFISSPMSETTTEQFRQRIQKAFAKFDLNSEDYCIILPRLSHTDFIQLNLVADISLDTLSWSGGNTTFIAIACNLPIVTYPGEFMRGRHSDGILKMLGVTDTIASNEAEYIKIAVRLGLDSQWRESIRQKIAANHTHLYNDVSCVRGLETFFEQSVENYISK